MNGDELYQMYAEAMDTQGVAVDDWHDLDFRDQAAWNAVAEQLEKKR
jgi:hypothetical protein